MVGKEDDVEADLPLMDLGAMEGGMEEELVAAWVFCGEFLCPNKENNLWTPTTHGKMMVKNPQYIWLGGGFRYVFLFSSRILGKMNPFLTFIFFKWVETTNQFL